MSYEDKISAFEEIQIRQGNRRVTWEYIGEGWEGDFSPANPDDVPLLRFSCDTWKNDEADKLGLNGWWAQVRDGSYCTAVRIDAPRRTLLLATEQILDALEDVSPKRMLERLSWVRWPQHQPQPPTTRA